MRPATPTGPAFDIVLLLHVAAVVVALGSVVVSGVQARRLLAAGEAGPSPGLAAYFAPGVNWVGRTLYAVPLLGLALLGLSQGAFRLADAWVAWGLGLWVLAALGGEVLLWPAERRIQARLAGEAAAGPAGASAGDGGEPAASEVRRDCVAACAAAAGLAAVLVLAIVLMVAQP